MIVAERINAFQNLGSFLHQLEEAEFQSIALQARLENPWFTEDNVRLAFQGIQSYLDKEKIASWLPRYTLPTESKRIGLVLAGNIPLVGFHDLLCVLLAGHRAVIKLSSKDSSLTRYVLNKLLEFAPALRDQIEYAEQLKSFDAVIATGSDNASRYFDYYFGKYPNIIRKNRTSIAVLTGNETKEELEVLAHDVFSYFGLGCRNVSKILIPRGFSVSTILDAWPSFQPIIHHHKYCNNYDYQKSILLVNKSPFLDNGFVMFQESARLVSPISVVYYEVYNDLHDLHQKVQSASDKIQCIVGKADPATVGFGQAQSPDLWDYADQVDTMAFLCSLKN